MLRPAKDAEQATPQPKGALYNRMAVSAVFVPSSGTLSISGMCQPLGILRVAAAQRSKPLAATKRRQGRSNRPSRLCCHVGTRSRPVACRMANICSRRSMPQSDGSKGVYLLNPIRL